MLPFFGLCFLDDFLNESCGIIELFFILLFTGNLGSPVDVNVGDGSETSPGQQNGLVTLSQIMDFLGSMLPGENVRGNTSSQQSPMASTEQGEGRNLATPEVSGASAEALRFASMVRQIMPFISQVETQNQSAPPDSSSTPAQAIAASAHAYYVYLVNFFNHLVDL